MLSTTTKETIEQVHRPTKTEVNLTYIRVAKSKPKGYNRLEAMPRGRGIDRANGQ